MLYVPDPFIPIYRAKPTGSRRLMECQCVAIVDGKWQWTRYTLESHAICSDDAGELARVLLAPTTYEPTIEEFRWWIDQNQDRIKWKK